MFSPIAFFHSASSSWFILVGTLSSWFFRPLLVLSVFGLLFGLTSLIPRHSIRRLFRRGTVTFALIYLVSIFPLTVTVAEAVLKKAVPQDSGATADAVVILGRGEALNSSRAEVAAHLWQENRAPLIFASGIYDSPRLLTLLRAKGIPESALEGESHSRTTYENARFTADLLRPQGIRRILLVTDGPHMLRSFLTFRGFGFEVIPAPSASPRHLDRIGHTRLVLREYLGLVSYGLLGRFSSHGDTRATLTAPQATVSQETSSQETSSQETSSQETSFQETISQEISTQQTPTRTI